MSSLLHRIDNPNSAGVLTSVYLLLWTGLARGNRPAKLQTRSPRPQVSEIRCRTACVIWGVLFFVGVFPGSIGLLLADEATEKIDLSIPVSAARPVVWFDDWSPVEQATSPLRQAAQAAMLTADRLKSAKQFDAAETAYLKAMRIDPTWGYPPYQLACNYELSGQHEKAVPVFAKAVKLGFDDFPTALDDDELGKLRDAADFSKSLAKIRERYIQINKFRVGQAVAIRPEGAAPAGGWPVMLMLHGYGDSNVNYLPLAKEWAKLGYVAIAVPGSIPGRTSGFIWSLDSTDQTLSDLKKILAAPLLKDIVDQQKVFLLGFSQGALHAMLLAAKQPELFAGAVALSPGGSLSPQLISPQIAKGRSGRLVFIHGTDEPHAGIVDVWRAACQIAGWKFLSRTHEGGHHFPEDWETIRPEIARFLAE